MKHPSRYAEGLWSISLGITLCLCANIKIPTVTTEAVQRAAITQVCAGDDRSAPFAWILWFGSGGSLLYAIVLIFPELGEGLASIPLLLTQRPQIPQAVADHPNLPELEIQTEVASEPDFEDSDLLDAVDEQFSSLPDHLRGIIYLAARRSRLSEDDRALTPTHVAQSNHKYLKGPRPKARETEAYFQELQTLGIGVCLTDSRPVKFLLKE